MPGFRSAGRSKNHLISGGLEECKMPLSYLLSQQQLVDAHACSPAFYKANKQLKMVFGHCSADSFCPILQMLEHLLFFLVTSLLPALR